MPLGTYCIQLSDRFGVHKNTHTLMLHKFSAHDAFVYASVCERNLGRFQLQGPTHTVSS